MLLLARELNGFAGDLPELINCFWPNALRTGLTTTTCFISISEFTA
jgi:hypothetical protein